MGETIFDVDVDVIQRRVIAAIVAADVNRFEVEFEWPECHKPRCQGSHGRPESAFALMKHRIIEAVQDELRFHATTRVDGTSYTDSPEDAAVFALGVLLSRYNVHDTGTWARAARLIIDAYPALISALSGSAVQDHTDGSTK